MISKSMFQHRLLLSLSAGTLFWAASNYLVCAETAGGASNRTVNGSSTHLAIATTSSTTDTSPINAQISLLAKALASADARAMGALWSESGQYIDKDGNKYEGRIALEKRFAALFNVEGKRSVQLVPETTKFLSDDIAYTEGKVLVGDNGVPETRYVVILVKQNGNWLIQNATEVPLVNDDKAISSGLGDLSWIIGSWQGEGTLANVKMKAHWDADKHLIECRYDVKRTDQPDQVDIQVIGFDSNTHQPVSWHFDSTGNYGFGNWFPKGKRWMVDSNGVESDGSVSNATILIENIQPDSFTWQSVDRHVGGVHLADTNPVNVKRIQSTADPSN